MKESQEGCSRKQTQRSEQRRFVRFLFFQILFSVEEYFKGLGFKGRVFFELVYILYQFLIVGRVVRVKGERKGSVRERVGVKEGDWEIMVSICSIL